jgi:branched-chain amino acid transport system substrate-binding protein
VNRCLTILAVSAGLMVLSCGARPDRIVVGIGMAPNTHDAVRLAAREINAQGGIGGVPLELSGLEWAGLKNPFDPVEVLTWADRFVETRDLVAVVGHSDSASTISAAPSYNRGGVPQIVTIATNPAITNIGAWTYRLCLSDARQGPALAEYAVKDWNKRRIAIIFVNDDYGRGLAQLFEKRVRELGAEIVASVMHRNALQADDQEMIRFAIAGMKKGPPPDLVALFQRTIAAQWTILALRDAGIDVDMLGGDNLAQAALLALGEEVTRGFRVSQFYDLEPGNPRAVQFAKDYRTLTGSDPDYSQAFAYDAIHLIKDAVLEGGYSRAGVKAYLDGLIQDRASITGAGGSFTIGPDHDARRPLFIAEIRAGRFQIIKSLPVQ